MNKQLQVMGWVGSGLVDFSLSRAKVEWGIRVPWDASQTVYVWVDALHGYLSGVPARSYLLKQDQNYN